jgi:hypothetical protein
MGTEERTWQMLEVGACVDVAKRPVWPSQSRIRRCSSAGPPGLGDFLSAHLQRHGRPSGEFE